MERKYFLNDGKKQFGPLNFEEISRMPLMETAKVWVEGSENWKNIGEYEELKPFIIKLPPPIPKNDKNSKLIAKEIKVNLKLLLIALIVGVVSYPVIAYLEGGFKSLSYQREFKALFENYNVSSVTTDTSITEPNANFIEKRDALINEVERFMPQEDLVYSDVQDYEHFNFDRGVWNTKRIFSYSTSLEKNIKRSFGVDTIFLSIVCLALTSIILICGRYLFRGFSKGAKWIKLNSETQ